MTDQIERGARAYIERIDAMGGTLAAIENGFISGEIQNAAYAAQQAVERGEAVVVGVNRFEEADGHPPVTFRIDPTVDEWLVRSGYDVARGGAGGERAGGTGSGRTRI